MGSERQGYEDTVATLPILELLAEIDIAIGPSAIQYELEQRMMRPPSDPTTYRALKLMREDGRVEQPEGSLYRITEAGQQYLRTASE